VDGNNHPLRFGLPHKDAKSTLLGAEIPDDFKFPLPSTLIIRRHTSLQPPNQGVQRTPLARP